MDFSDLSKDVVQYIWTFLPVQDAIRTVSVSRFIMHTSQTSIARTRWFDFFAEGEEGRETQLQICRALVRYKASRLQFLRVSGASGLYKEPETLQCLLDNNQSIRSLCFGRHVAGFFETIGTIARRNLSFLSLSSHHPDTFLNLMGIVECVNLKTLLLNIWGPRSDQQIQNVLQRCTSIKVLCLRLKTRFEMEECPPLLNITHFYTNRSFPLKQIPKFVPNLEELQLEKVTKLVCTSQTCSFAPLIHLEQLTFTFGFGREDMLGHLGVHFPALKSVQFHTFDGGKSRITKRVFSDYALDANNGETERKFDVNHVSKVYASDLLVDMCLRAGVLEFKQQFQNMLSVGRKCRNARRSMQRNAAET